MKRKPELNPDSIEMNEDCEAGTHRVDFDKPLFVDGGVRLLEIHPDAKYREESMATPNEERKMNLRERCSEIIDQLDKSRAMLDSMVGSYTEEVREERSTEFASSLDVLENHINDINYRTHTLLKQIERICNTI